MIIKEVGSRVQDIAMLESLLNHSNADTYKRKQIAQQLRNIRRGVKGEKNAAYHIDFELKNSKNWAVIHDVRFEHAGRVAQIDHLLINRFLEVWVCESKYWANGISINEYGEFTSFYEKSPIGIASPLEQNRNHITLLNAMFRDQAVALPQRLGVSIKPKLMSAVLVSTNARIDRPKAKVEGLETIVKADQFISRLVRKIETPTISLMKIVSSETLQSFAVELTAADKPKQRDWESSFGLAKSPVRPVDNQAIFSSKTPYQVTTHSVLPQVRGAALDQTLRQPQPYQPPTSKPTSAPIVAPAQDANLLMRLKAKRLEIATEIAKPAYVVFTNKTLDEMVQKRPVNREQMLKVTGVGSTKFERYGTVFLDVISKA